MNPVPTKTDFYRSECAMKVANTLRAENFRETEKLRNLVLKRILRIKLFQNLYFLGAKTFPITRFFIRTTLKEHEAQIWSKNKNMLRTT